MHSLKIIKEMNDKAMEKYEEEQTKNTHKEAERDGVVNNIVYNIAQDLLHHNRRFKNGFITEEQLRERVRTEAWRLLALI